MNNEQMKRIGMFANFDGTETAEVPAESVNDPGSDNTALKPTIDEFLEANGLDKDKLPEDGLLSELSEKPDEGGADVEYELVKEKKPVVTDKRRKFVRLALVAFALFVAYRLFFSKRR